MTDQEILDQEWAQTSKSNFNPSYAGFGIRFIAAVIDTFAFIPFAYLFAYCTFHDLLELAFLILIAQIAYKPVMEYYFGATLGKLALDLRVVNLQYEKISVLQAILRYLPWLLQDIMEIYLFLETYYLISTGSNIFSSSGILSFITTQDDQMNLIFGLIFLVDILILLSSPQSRALHDRLAGTYCIYKPNAAG